MKIFNDAGGCDGITTSDDVANANQAFTSPFLLRARVIFHSSEKTLFACNCRGILAKIVLAVTNVLKKT